MDASDRRLKKLLEGAPREQLVPLFERHGIDPGDDISELVREIGRDGANTFASVFRGGKGVPYLEVVRDVAAQLKIEDRDDQDEAILERRVLEAVIEEIYESGDEGLKKAIHGIAVGAVAGAHASAITSGALAAALPLLAPELIVQLVRTIVLRLSGRWAARQAGTVALRAAGWAVPVLTAGMAIWTIVDLAGPAFRKTIPTVVEIAVLRMQAEDNNS